jgi:hypothetical protein
VLAYARRTPFLTDVSIQGLSFVDVSSGPTRMSSVHLKDCQFVDVDLRDAFFEACEGASSDFDGIALNNSSRMDIAGLHPGANVRRVHHDPPGDVYAPDAIAILLSTLGAPIEAEAATQPSYSKHAKELIALLQHLPRVFQRTTILYEKEDRRHQALLSSPDWEELKRLLINHGVIVKEMREAKGANVPAYRLRANIDELLAGQRGGDSPHSSTAGLWQELRSMRD